MNKEEMKLRIIEVIADLGSEAYTNALYEIVVDKDFDYIPNMFDNMEDFFEFVEKWKPNKCFKEGREYD